MRECAAEEPGEYRPSHSRRELTGASVGVEVGVLGGYQDEGAADAV